MGKIVKTDMRDVPYWILALQAKDIYNYQKCFNSEIKNGYPIKNSKGEINLRRFSMEMDNSLDLKKIQEVYENHYLKQHFGIEKNGRYYTTALINVYFKYAFKNFNMVCKNVYVKAGYYLKDIKFDDCICIKDGKIVAVQTEKKVKNHPSELPEEFYFDSASRKIKVNQGAYTCIRTRYGLRKEFYENGFVVNGKKYVRYKRSSGSSREGHCLFILESLYKEINEWSKCGLDVKDDMEISLSEWEAYTSLTLSSTEKFIELNPRNILVLQDEQSIFKEKVVAVSLNEKNEVESKIEKKEISNVIWDGEGLLDVSVFNENGYADKGMMLLRNRFFKACVFNTNLQKWFKDNNITDVSQLQGDTMAKNIEDIKMVVTTSSIKYLKFGTLKQWRNEVGNEFGVVKTEKPTHFFDGNMVQTNYQLLNTLKLSSDDVKSLLEDSINYIQLVRNDYDVLKYHIHFQTYHDDDDSEVKLIEDIVWKMLCINPKFARTQIFKDFRAKLVKSLRKKVLFGKVLVHGTYATLFGNGYEFLRSTIMPFDGKSHSLKKGQVMCNFFDFNKKILAQRSPHITMGNLYLCENVENTEIKKYFNLSREIICVNAIEENLQQRLNGCDYDSDSMLITDDELLIRRACEHYDEFLIPSNFIAVEKILKVKNGENLAILDHEICNNLVGEIVNKSQYLNSIYWDKLCNGEKDDQLYTIICKLAVLSGIEIDKAKRQTFVDMRYEMDVLKEHFIYDDDNSRVKPLFFLNLDKKHKDTNHNNSDNVYKKFNTSMDYVYECIRKQVGTGIRSETIPFMSVINKPENTYGRNGNAEKCKERVLDLVEKIDDEISVLFQSMKNVDKAEKSRIYKQIEDLRNDCIYEIRDSMKNEWAMYYTLKTLDDSNCRYRWTLLFALFNERNHTFFKLIEHSCEKQCKVVKCTERDAQMHFYKYPYKKIKEK